MYLRQFRQVSQPPFLLRFLRLGPPRCLVHFPRLFRLVSQLLGLLVFPPVGPRRSQLIFLRQLRLLYHLLVCRLVSLSPAQRINLSHILLANQVAIQHFVPLLSLLLNPRHSRLVSQFLILLINQLHALLDYPHHCQHSYHLQFRHRSRFPFRLQFLLRSLL